MNIGVLLSGGLDSTALTWWLRPSIAFTIDYGQASAKGEVRAAAAVCAEARVAHEIISINCADLGSGDLAGRAALPIAPMPEWWPYRNQLLVTLAAMRAIALGIDCLVTGSVSSDNEHADGTEAFYRALDRVMHLQEGGIRIQAPAVSLDSVALIRRSGIPRSVLAWAHSCHTSEYACGSCRGCRKHFIVTGALWGEGY